MTTIFFFQPFEIFLSVHCLLSLITLGKFVCNGLEYSIQTQCFPSLTEILYMSQYP